MTSAIDPVWDEKYGSGHAELYPWDIVVSFVLRNASRRRPRGETHILELGCGTGANLWFAAREGFSVAGIDGAPAAIEFARRRFAAEGLKGDLRVGLFHELPFLDGSFDLVVDRGALVCTGRSTARTAIREVHRVLRQGGRFLFNPYSDRHSSCRSGTVGSDGMVSGIAKGTLTGVGALAFYGRSDVEAALGDGWALVSLQHAENLEMARPEYTAHAEWRAIVEKVSGS